jgi:hypothetical protein
MVLREIGLAGEWIHLAQNRDRWQALVSAVMNLWVLAPQSYLVLGTPGVVVLTLLDVLNMYSHYLYK